MIAMDRPLWNSRSFIGVKVKLVCKQAILMVERIREMGFVPGVQVSAKEKEVGETGNVRLRQKKSFWSFWS